MRAELSIERDVAHDELVTAIARSLGVDRERIHVDTRPQPGDFALRVALDLPDASDLVAFYRTLASTLACKLLVDDDAHDPHTAMLVTPSGDAVRVTLEARDDNAVVIAGLHHHAYADDEVPDTLIPDARMFTAPRGAVLAADLPPPLTDAELAAYSPREQDAIHQLTELLHELVDRPATPDDLRIVRRATAALRSCPDAVRLVRVGDGLH